MRQNVILTIFHTQNICHHAWKTGVKMFHKNVESGLPVGKYLFSFFFHTLDFPQTYQPSKQLKKSERVPHFGGSVVGQSFQILQTSSNKSV